LTLSSPNTKHQTVIFVPEIFMSLKDVKLTNKNTHEKNPAYPLSGSDGQLIFTNKSYFKLAGW
jgi:hypothetical protein